MRKELAEAGDMVVLALLNIVITDFVSFFNVGKGMTDEQIKSTSALIAKNFYFLKPEDFKCCFENAKIHLKVFDRMDGNLILGLLNDYCEERAAIAEQTRLLEHDAIKQKELNNKIEYSPEIVKQFTQLREDLEKDVKKKDVKKEDEYQKFKKEYLSKEDSSELLTPPTNQNGKVRG